MEKQVFIDSHCHVQFPAYDQDRDEVITRASTAGIGMVNIGTQYQTSADAVALAGRYPDALWATVGFHPNHVGADAHHDPQELREQTPEQFDYGKFQELARQPKVVAVGECGLDYHRLGDRGQVAGGSLCEEQEDIFLQQIELAKEVKKPLVVHCRSAFDNLIHVLSPITLHLSPHGNGVVHFFSGSWDDAEKLLDLGFYLGFGGVITFAREYDEVVRKVPLDRLLVETDAPYVSPAPYRGQRNEPAYIVETVKKIAELRGISTEAVAAETTANGKRLFGI